MKNLTDKVAVVFAASGEISGAVAKALARHGAKVYLSARNLNSVNTLKDHIKGQGGKAEVAKVDALNEHEIDNYLQGIVKDNGKLDIVFNGIGANYKEMGGRPATTDATFEQFITPFTKVCGSQFLTSRIAARYMIETKTGGTILTLTAALSRSKLPNVAGITTASAAIEGLTRVMAAEWGSAGIKVICLCPGALIETERISGWIKSVADQYKIPVEQIVSQYQAFDILKVNPTLHQVGETAAMLASEAGVVFNSHVVDIDCGKLNIL